MSATVFKFGESVSSKTGVYTLIKQLQECVWLASNQNQDKVIFKSIRHFRLQNELDVLLRFQAKTPYIRPLLDEIEKSPAIILRYLEDDLLQSSNRKRLSRSEVKFVARRVLEALDTLHNEGFVHTDIKPSNVLVNYGSKEEVRFTDVQLCDFGSTVPEDSEHALNGDPIGTPIFRSPEAHIQMRWGKPTDIWSFGATLVSLMYGERFHLFKPDVPVDHDEYAIKILRKHHQCFGPFPVSYEQIADEERLGVLTWIMNSTPKESLKPFRFTTEREICKEDRDIVCKIMQLDPRDRPTTRELLEDEWFRRSL